MVKINFLTNVSKKKLYYGLLAVGVSICIIGVGITLVQHNRSQPVAEEVPIVRTAVIGNGSRDVPGYTYSGEVRGRYESQLAFQVTGKIIKRNVQLGSAVNTGELLMQIDSRDLQQTVNSNSAQVSSAESQLKLAESNLNRYRQLLESGAISRAQYDQYASAYEVALAGVQQASAQYAQGSNQLDYSLLLADKPGVVSSIAAEAGQVVSAGQTVITVVQDGEREVEISVPENRIEELRRVGQIKVTFWALPNLNVTGSIREIAPMADQTTRTFKVRVSLLNPSPEIKLGMTAAVTIAGNTQPTVTIPLAAVYQDGNTPEVWVVKENVLTLQPIQAGNIGNGTIQVISGLQQGDRIVISGVHKLKEGQKVKISGDSL
ncbi:Multidrug resistance protein MdtE [Sporomusa silvacetica DSM 10669]|uniref:Multidrug resistance protein MdtE n=1 Tax=Sporomusa silvacetica DSM 10669 TaxID=1123289 RepID=A0ABZ3IQ35_9FIRM|nr:efflux RND transporter periplasmic adaptor subunit [Sporomusa silvacetica]OZC17198.1 multidrug resistance protein MdtE precursor [Sporomusa silvacetica DSM 10669]